MESSVGYREGEANYKLRPLIVVESPFSSSTFEERTRNIKMVMNVCRLAVIQGFNPYASHLFFAAFLKDEIAHERNLGIELGLIWGRFAEEVWFVLRSGEDMSPGMIRALSHHVSNRRRLRWFRTDDNGVSLREVTMFQGEYRVEQPVAPQLGNPSNPPTSPAPESGLPVLPEEGGVPENP